ncbi:MAG TPA: FmdB family zinc ribbon protein [Candidatus Eisenbacteria bacterium]|jgi:putative FmdB family regulatory protein|nr:FmdB family zinc ribbon protein [Candidatus Eisenbacteria bacterium]
MPTYDYRCLKCKKTFEQMQKMSDPPLKKCVRCGGKVERLIGAGAGLIFKGSGFYITDYKKPSASKDSKDVTPAKAKKESPAKKKDDAS